MKRRTFLAAVGTLVPLAGCTAALGRGTDSSGDGQGCAESERFDIVDVVEDDELGGFTLSVTPNEVQQGGTVTVRMENASDGERITGNRHKFTIDQQVDGEWQSVFTRSQGAGWNDIGIGHAPGEGFTWEIEVSQTGFSDASNNLDACATVEPGSYRFVYWGVGADEAEETDWEEEYALGARFSVTE